MDFIPLFLLFTLEFLLLVEMLPSWNDAQISPAPTNREKIFLQQRNTLAWNENIRSDTYQILSRMP